VVSSKDVSSPVRDDAHVSRRTAFSGLILGGLVLAAGNVAVATTEPPAAAAFEIPADRFEALDAAGMGWMFDDVEYPEQPEGVAWPTDEWRVGDLPAGWMTTPCRLRSIPRLRRVTARAGSRRSWSCKADGLSSSSTTTGGRRAAPVVVDGEVDHAGDARHPRVGGWYRRLRTGAGAGVV